VKKEALLRFTLYILRPLSELVVRVYVKTMRWGVPFDFTACGGYAQGERRKNEQ